MDPRFVSLCDQTLEIRTPFQVSPDVDVMFRHCMAPGKVANRCIKVATERRGRFLLEDGIGTISGDLDRKQVSTKLLAATIKALVRDMQKCLPLRAGVVVANGKAILIPEVAGVGKSVFTAWLLYRGLQYVSDALAVMDPETLNVGGLPSALRIPSEMAGSVLSAAPFLGCALVPCDTAIILRPETQPVSTGGRWPVGIIIFPVFQSGATLGIQPMSPAAAGLQLVSCNLAPGNSSDGGVSAIARLVRSTVALSVVFGHFDQLGAMSAFIDAFQNNGTLPLADLISRLLSRM